METETLLLRILKSDAVEKAVVIVAPVEELLARAKNRKFIEEDHGIKEEYPSDDWSKAIRDTDLFSLYEQLFELLEKTNTEFEVVYSSENVNGFAPSDATFAHHISEEKIQRHHPKSKLKPRYRCLGPSTKRFGCPGINFQAVGIPTSLAAVHLHFLSFQKLTIETAQYWISVAPWATCCSGQRGAEPRDLSA